MNYQENSLLFNISGKEPHPIDCPINCSPEMWVIYKKPQHTWTAKEYAKVSTNQKENTA